MAFGFLARARSHAPADGRDATCLQMAPTQRLSPRTPPTGSRPVPADAVDAGADAGDIPEPPGYGETQSPKPSPSPTVADTAAADNRNAPPPPTLQSALVIGVPLVAVLLLTTIAYWFILRWGAM